MTHTEDRTVIISALFLCYFTSPSAGHSAGLFFSSSALCSIYGLIRDVPRLVTIHSFSHRFLNAFHFIYVSDRKVKGEATVRPIHVSSMFKRPAGEVRSEFVHWTFVWHTCPERLCSAVRFCASVFCLFEAKAWTINLDDISNMI